MDPRFAPKRNLSGKKERLKPALVRCCVSPICLQQLRFRIGQDCCRLGLGTWWIGTWDLRLGALRSWTWDLGFGTRWIKTWDFALCGLGLGTCDLGLGDWDLVDWDLVDRDLVDWEIEDWDFMDWHLIDYNLGFGGLGYGTW